MSISMGKNASDPKSDDTFTKQLFKTRKSPKCGKKIFSQKNSISGNRRFEIAGFTNKISKFTKKGVFWLNICKTNYCNILTQIFGNFWQHLEISGIWKLGIGKSGNAPKLASLGQFQHIGYFSHSVKVTELGFELRISKF